MLLPSTKQQQDAGSSLLLNTQCWLFPLPCGRGDSQIPFPLVGKETGVKSSGVSQYIINILIIRCSNQQATATKMTTMMSLIRLHGSHPVLGAFAQVVLLPAGHLMGTLWGLATTAWTTPCSRTASRAPAGSSFC
jgi:hypothetical protein